MAKSEKIERILFYIFLFLIPFQIRALINWNGNEWNSIFLYLTDVLFFLVLALWLKRIKDNKIHKILGLFITIAFLSIIIGVFVGSGTLAFAYWVRLIMFILLFTYVSRNKSNKMYVILAVSGVFQSILAIAQFIKQSSLGERGLGVRFIESGVFAPGAPGVATFITENGDKIMRGYGSFPHPNILSAFLILSIFCLFVLWFNNYKKLFIIPSLLITVFALFITFSRTTIVAFIVMSLIMFLFMIKKKQAIKLFSIFLLACIISIAILFPLLKSRFLTISFEEQALDLRFFYNRMAFEMIKQKPLLGIGVGNFVWYSQSHEVFLRAANKMVETVYGETEALPDWIYQPIHNIYLLIAVEMGLIGLIVFLILIGKFLIKRLTVFSFLFIAFLIIGLMDHYFWTIQPGGLMFWLSLGLLYEVHS